MWVEVSVEVPAEAVDAVANHLIESGAPGVIEETGASPARIRVRAHFAEAAVAEVTAGLRRFLDRLDADFPGAAAADVETLRVHEDDWAEGWKQHFPPIDIGSRLRIRPPWMPPGSDGRLEVVIEPARAFGTGQHASTRGCLLATEDLFAAGVLSPVLDVGTGSGILSIAAVRLGASEVLAIDVDDVAVATATENFRRNGVADRARALAGTIPVVGGSYPLVLANLLAGILIDIFPELAERTIPRGWVVGSGLLDADAEVVADAGRASGLHFHKAYSIDGWTTLVLRKEG
jgi:ribosomal protein L11 methyltransferase